MILKFLLWTFVICYILYKLGGFFMRSMLFLFGRKMQKQYAQQQANAHNSHNHHYRRKPTDGNVEIDYVPEKEEKKKAKHSKNYQGGEYIDYEEIK